MLVKQYARILGLLLAVMLLIACGGAGGGGGDSNSSAAAFGDTARGEVNLNSTGSRLTDGNLTAGGEFNQTLPGGNGSDGSGSGNGTSRDDGSSDSSGDDGSGDGSGGGSGGSSSGDGSSGGSGDDGSGGNSNGGSSGSGDNGSGTGGSSGNLTDGGSGGGNSGGGGSSGPTEPLFLKLLNSRFSQNADSDGDGIKNTLDLDDDGNLLIEIHSAQELDDLRNYLTVRGNETNTGAAARDCGSLLHFVPCRGYELTADISLADYPHWQPIGVCYSGESHCTSYFDDVFEGKGHSITGLHINLTEAELLSRYAIDTGLGLFGVVGRGAQFSNLRFSHAYLRSDVGGLGVLFGDIINSDYAAAGEYRYHIQNISVADSYLEGDGYTGGLVGFCYRCAFDAVTISNTYVVSAGDNSGGLAGQCNGCALNAVTLANSSVIAAGAYIGGLVGGVSGSIIHQAVVEDLYLAGEGAVGGIFGDVQTSQLANLRIVNSFINGTENQVGAIMGSAWKASVSNAVAAGNRIAGKSQVGGISGSHFGAPVHNSSSHKNIIHSATANAGGLVGWASTADIGNASAQANNISAATNLGGIAGFFKKGAISFSSASENTIQGAGADAANIGGIIGGAQSGDSIITPNRAGRALYAGAPATAILDSYAADNYLRGAEYVGGLAGNVLGADIWRSYVLGGQLRATDKAGGIAGGSRNNYIKDSYVRGLELHILNGSNAADGAAPAELSVGGLLGRSDDSPSIDTLISTSYAAGLSIDYSQLSGVALNYGPIVGEPLDPLLLESSYWGDNTLLLGAEELLRTNNSFPAAGLSQAQLQLPSSANGIFANWGAASQCADGSPAWSFGTAEQYPALTCPPGGAARQP